MKLKMVLIVALSLIPGVAFAGGLSDCGLGKSDCKDLIGKRLWISVPKANPNSVEVSTTQYDYDNTLKLRTGSFLVKDVIPNKTIGYDFVVSLPNGTMGYVWNSSYIFLLDFDPIAEAKKSAEECQRRGQPKIGMTSAELIASCWGKPLRIVKKTTAASVEENFVYGAGHVVKFSDGKISEIVEAR